MSVTSLAAEQPGSIAEASHKVEGFWGSALRRLRRNHLATAGAIFILVLALAALFVPAIYPHHYAHQDYSAVTQGPTWDHPMGTDHLGRDILSRLIFGARI